MPHIRIFLGFSRGSRTWLRRSADAAIDVAKVALSFNPACSADLWNILGDALYEFGRSRHNLTWVCTRQKDYPMALQMIAEALAHDKTGQLRERLLQKPAGSAGLARDATPAGLPLVRELRQPRGQAERQGRGSGSSGPDTGEEGLIEAPLSPLGRGLGAQFVPHLDRRVFLHHAGEGR
jgi:hypothetical protein